MGSFISSHKMFDNYNVDKNSKKNNYKNNICFLCLEHIKEKEYTVCVRCNIGIHNICEELDRTNKYYTVCPRCERCGSLASKISK